MPLTLPARALCWLMLSLVFTRYPFLPSCFPPGWHVLVPGLVSSQRAQDFVLPLMELQEVPVSPFLQLRSFAFSNSKVIVGVSLICSPWGGGNEARAGISFLCKSCHCQQQNIFTLCFLFLLNSVVICVFWCYACLFVHLFVWLCLPFSCGTLGKTKTPMLIVTESWVCSI